MENRTTTPSLPLQPDELQSKTIAWLRFPLILFVVTYHMWNPFLIQPEIEASSELFPYKLGCFILFQCTGLRVPMFFFISGCLFFYGQSFTRATYRTKLVKRFSSLLIPYLIWNAIYWLIYIGIGVVSPSAYDAKFGSDLSVGEWIYSVFYSCIGQGGGAEYAEPADGPLWFMRDLITICLCTPLIYFAIKYLRFVAVLLTGALYLFEHWVGYEHFFISTTCLFFFSLGSYFSINRKNIITSFKPLYKWSYIVWPILTVIIVIDHYVFPFLPFGLLQLNNIVGVIALWGIVSHGISTGKLRVIPFLWSATFFLYACHYIFMNRLVSGMILEHIPVNNYVLPLISLLCLLVVTTVCVLGYHILYRISPKITNIMCGSRK